MKRILATAIAFLLTVGGSTFAFAEEEAQSAAEGCSAWAEKEVAEAIELGFVPEEIQADYTKPVTRQEFARTALCFAAMQYNCNVEDYAGLYCRYYENIDISLEAPQAFDDCQDYYVTQARAAGLVNGVGNNLFQPERSITREESAVLLENAYLSYTGQRDEESPGGGTEEDSVSEEGSLSAESKTSESQTSETLAFKDRDQIADWAADSVAVLSDWGVMNGTGQDLFSPEGTYTREQCIVSFLRLYHRAPVSREHDGRALCPYSPEELTAQVRSMDFYHEEKALENELCTVLWGYQSTNRGNLPVVSIVYKNGGMYDLSSDLLQLYGASGAIQSVEFGAEEFELKVTGTDPESGQSVTRTADLSKRTLE